MICFYEEAPCTLRVAYETVYYNLLRQLNVGRWKRIIITHYTLRISCVINMGMMTDL